MNKIIELSVLPEACANEASVLQAVIRHTGRQDVQAIRIIRKSLDARRHPIKFNLSVELITTPDSLPEPAVDFGFRPVHQAQPVIIVGSGPAGLFAALKCLELGRRPIVVERGKMVRERRRDLAAITRNMSVDPDSNYCFGEGGAGTYSDGKLYTRSTKRGNVSRILQLFIAHGAGHEISYEAHPHIGTNKLPGIISQIRQTIESFGGQFHFNSRVSDLLLDGNQIKGVQLADGTRLDATSVILATGHSARDIFEMLHRRHIAIEAKPFALGVRIEHPQELIDQIQYKCQRGEFLPPASYSIVNQSLGRGVFSFCMCPGGIIAPAATAPGEIVVNGWSPSKRNNAFANSGIVVAVDQQDFAPYASQGPLAAMSYQAAVEQACYNETGSLQAPAQRVTDFLRNQYSTTLPECSYLPGIQSVDLRKVLPQAVHASLRDALKVFGGKLKGYITDDALMVATESRTSSPVRIPRDKETLMHPQIKGLFPSGEGAGYAGGIISAAIDGERCAEMACRK